jgi:hypothetical protein
VSKIDEAVARFTERFGYAPNACHLNPRDLVQHDNLLIISNSLIQPNHFWVGMEDDEAIASTQKTA